VKVTESDRRVSTRHNFNIPIRIRLWKSAVPEQRGQSENLSEGGILFARDAALPIGTVVEVLLKMPELISGKPSTEWLCTGHVVRVEPVDSPRGKVGISVQFDCYQVSPVTGPVPNLQCYVSPYLK
jgi:hypothetical protein